MGEIGEVSIAVTETLPPKTPKPVSQPPPVPALQENEIAAEETDTESLVSERLNPRHEEDNGGFGRTVYSFNGKSFTFRGREELPIYPTLSSSKSRLLGDEPKWVGPEDWQVYQKQVSETQSQASAEHLVVSRTPLGVVEAAIELGAVQEGLVALRDEIRAGVYSERTLEIIDQLMAADFIDDSGEFLDTPSLEGEGLVILSLLGDEKAKEIVDRKVEEMRRHDEEVVEQNKRREPEAEPYKIEDLVVVHATTYLPQQDDQGRYIIRTTQDAIGQKMLRNSVHFSLNGKVEANDGGDWSDSNYVVIEPMTDMVKDNGLPQELVPVDTFWARNPGEPLILSNPTLVVPDTTIDDPYEFSGNMVKIKTNVDVAELKSLPEDNSRRFIFNIENRFVQALPAEDAPWVPDPENLLSDWDTQTAMRKVRAFLHGGESQYYDQIEEGKSLIEFLTKETGAERGNLQDRIIDLLEESGATSSIKPGVDRFLATDKLARVLSETVKAATRTRIQEMAVKATIERLGFEVKAGGDYTWDQESYSRPNAGVEARQRMEALASQLGITAAPHTKSASGNISQSILRSIGAAESEYGAKDFDWKKYELNPYVFGKFIPQLDPKTRRSLYATGLLNARA